MMSSSFHLWSNSKTRDLVLHNVNFYNTSSCLEEKLSTFLIILKLGVNTAVGLPIGQHQLGVNRSWMQKLAWDHWNRAATWMTSLRSISQRWICRVWSKHASGASCMKPLQLRWKSGGWNYVPNLKHPSQSKQLWSAWMTRRFKCHSGISSIQQPVLHDTVVVPTTSPAAAISLTPRSRAANTMTAKFCLTNHLQQRSDTEF